MGSGGSSGGDSGVGGMVLGAVGSAIQTISTVQDARNQVAADKLSASQHLVNATLYQKQAASQMRAGLTSAEQNRESNTQEMGQIAASHATSGADVSSGSYLGTLASTALLNEWDTRQIVQNAAKEAYQSQISSISEIEQWKSKLDSAMNNFWNISNSDLYGGFFTGIPLGAKFEY
jgi:hypothetical protein